MMCSPVDRSRCSSPSCSGKIDWWFKWRRRIIWLPLVAASIIVEISKTPNKAINIATVGIRYRLGYSWPIFFSFEFTVSALCSWLKILGAPLYFPNWYLMVFVIFFAFGFFLRTTRIIVEQILPTKNITGEKNQTHNSREFTIVQPAFLACALFSNLRFFLLLLATYYFETIFISFLNRV